MSNSLVDAFLQHNPHVRVQTYFKASLTALSHAVEDLVLAAPEPTLIVANFQQEHFYRQEAGRYQRLAGRHRAYVLCASETGFTTAPEESERSPRVACFDPGDTLADEWHVVVLSQSHASCLICRERHDLTEVNALDSARVFEGLWSSDRVLAISAAELLLARVAQLRPDLGEEIDTVTAKFATTGDGLATEVGSQPFVDRLVTHLQAGQYKLLKAYRVLAAKETRERLLANTSAAIRHSLDPQDILQAVAEQVGQHLPVDRAIAYRYRDNSPTAAVAGEYRAKPELPALRGDSWLPWYGSVGLSLHDRQVPVTSEDGDRAAPSSEFAKRLTAAEVSYWSIVPISFQGRLLGAIEIHHCGTATEPLSATSTELLIAVAEQVSVALTQAEAYARLEDLNEQLAALDRTRSNLVAIAGHELRTPLSTIQVCLESLASEPDMSAELQQVMLNTALADTERMRQLIQDFLTLSQFESGRIDWNPEAVSLDECIELALSNLRARWRGEVLPEIAAPPEAVRALPLVRVDGEWLVEVLAKLLDNACKFTAAEGGHIAIAIECPEGEMVTVSVTDTGRGVEPADLERIFDRFYQEEGALQRTRNGTGLGLSICRQVVERWGGRIWAESKGRDTGTRIAFTVPSAARQAAG